MTTKFKLKGGRIYEKRKLMPEPYHPNKIVTYISPGGSKPVSHEIPSASNKSIRKQYWPAKIVNIKTVKPGTTLSSVKQSYGSR